MPDEPDFYGADQPAESAAEKPAKPDDEKPESETTLLPKSMFGGEVPEPGAICQFKVQHIWDKEVEVSWVPSEGKEEKMPHKAMDGVNDSFDKMAEPTTTE
jgi:hypothetical protein